MKPLILIICSILLLLGTGTRAQIDPAQSCIPGTFSSIKANLIRTLIICYVYGCPEELTDSLAKDFNEFHHYDMHPEALMKNDTTTTGAESVSVGILNKLAKLTSALEKDRVAALSECTDWMSLLNKLLVDILQANSKCLLEPKGKYPPDMPAEGDEIDCDEMTIYMRQLQKHFGGQCDADGKNCPETLKTAVNWFGRAYKQLGRSCYYDAYDYLDK